MRDFVLEAQRRGEIVSRNARDQEEEAPIVAWEEAHGLEAPPRRSPWRTIGVSNTDIVDSASDKDVPITPKNLSSFLGGSPTGRGGSTVIYTTVNETNVDEPSVSITFCSGFRVSNNKLIAEYRTIRLYGTVTSTSEETVLEGEECETL